MNFLARAWKNVSRKISKSILLALTFFVIGNFVIIGLGVSDAAQEAKVQTRKKMRAIIQYEIDYETIYDKANEIEDEDELNEFYRNMPTITQDELKEILADKRVKTVNALSTTVFYVFDSKAVPLNNKREENETSSEDEFDSYRYIEPDVKIQANSYPDMIEFADGMYTLKDGRMYSQEDIDNANKVCLVTDTFAEYNNLSVGDTISVGSNTEDDFNSYLADMGLSFEDTKLELEIIGIFDNQEKADPTAENFDWMGKSESPENIILMPDTTYSDSQYQVAKKRWDYYKQQYSDEEYYQDPANEPTRDTLSAKSSVVILLNDPLEVDGFVKELQAKQAEDSYRLIDANNETFDKLSKPLDTLSLFASFIVWLVIVNAVIIITLVTALTLKTREFEIGVLLSQGVSKGKIVAQFFVELSIVAILGFSLAVASGSLVAKQIGNKVLDYQVTLSDVQEEKEDDNMWYVDETNYFSDVTLEDITKNYEVQISPIIIGEIYIAGLGIVLISILIPSFMVMRFNPKRILMSAQ